MLFQGDKGKKHTHESQEGRYILRAEKKQGGVDCVVCVLGIFVGVGSIREIEVVVNECKL